MQRFVIFLFVTFVCVNTAFANLLISPTRLVFEGKDRTKSVVIINSSTETRSYRIEWVENSVNEYGDYSLIPSGQATFAASQFVRYSPRQVTLSPGERQTVKLMLRRSNKMTLAEYRSHLKFTALPSQNVDNNEQVTSGIGFKIKVATSYVIPIMVRTVPSNVDVDIVNTAINVGDNNSATIEVELKKIGKGSVNGELYVYLKTSANERALVGLLRGINIFHESTTRKASLKWQNYSGPIDGVITTEFVGSSEFLGTTFDVIDKKLNISDFK